HSEQRFPLKLVEFGGRKVEQFTFTNEASARAADAALRAASGSGAPPAAPAANAEGAEAAQAAAAAASGQLRGPGLDREERRRNPAPPFTTSTLQQEASRKLGFSAQRTMRTAQQLYEGVDIGEGNVGLITYMRTDSVALASEAVTEIRATIEKLYGRESLT